MGLLAAGGRRGGIVTCTVLTTEPNGLLAPIHDRMPVIVHQSAYGAWLDPQTPVTAVMGLVQPYPADEMRAWPVGFEVNDPKMDDEDILKPQA